MFYSLVRRMVLGGVQSVVLVASAMAATPSNTEFLVSTAQMQALGVTLITLDRPTAIEGTAYPARVVVPPSGNHVLSAPFAGRVEEVFVNLQQVVRAGQPLLRLVSPEYGQLQLALLEAASKAKLTKQNAIRERQLFAEGIIPERRIQKANAIYQEANARLRFAQASLRLAGVDPNLIRNMSEGNDLQDGLVLRAKSAGTIIGLEVTAGQRVQNSDALVSLVNTEQLWLDIPIPTERQQHALSNAADSIIVLGRDASATPVSVGTMVSDNQTVTLRARVVKGAELLRPGEAVQVQVPFVQNAAGWALPLSALARKDGQAYVFVRTEKGFVAQPVTVIASAGQSVQVTGELHNDQQLATGSVIALKSAWLGNGGSN
ncbi:efflux RND transporter periplasmic adaptor subunit [Allopusillimonas ginsengisoli]|uniref:efflux RND transporter periplasmic adaptor subunit n=1 Tax=Allopusillimonas ginsengisoli TaxID=453575 RepID=UPI0039C27E83